MSTLNAADSIKTPEEIVAGVEEIEETDHKTIVKAVQNNYAELRKKDQEVEKKQNELAEAINEFAQAQDEKFAAQRKYNNANAFYLTAERIFTETRTKFYETNVESAERSTLYDRMFEELEIMRSAAADLDEAEKVLEEANNKLENEKKEVEKAKEAAQNAVDAANEYSLYHARLVNLMMMMDEADSGKHECPYHINLFHESVCIHVFDRDFLQSDKEPDEDGGSGAEIEVDPTPDPDRGDDISTGVDSYTEFQKKIYNNGGNIFVTYPLPAFDENGNPLYNGVGERVYIDKQYSLEDDNQLNYLKYLRLSPAEYLDYFDYIGGTAKNVTPSQKLSDDARETAAYLPPLQFTGLSDNRTWGTHIKDFYSNKMAADYSKASSETRKNLMKIHDSLVVPDVIPKRESIGHEGEILCSEHLYSYHVIAQPLIDFVGDASFDNYMKSHSGENINIRSFVKRFSITLTKEKFIELTVDPGVDPSVNPNASQDAFLGEIAFRSDVAPYNVDMVFEESDAVAMEYFSVKR